jgi:RNA polymerase-binding transcription factor DksA
MMTPLNPTERQVLAERLRARHEVLRARLEEVETDLRHQRDPLSADFAEQAGELENDEVLESIRSAAEAELTRAQLALQRLEAGTYGSCLRCREPIEAARLAALPDAECCAACARLRPA